MSRNRFVAKAAIIVMGGFLASKLTGLLRQMVIARAFGTEAMMDAYNAAFTTPDIIFMLISGGALGTAFIPVFSSYLNRKSDEQVDQQAAWRMASNVLTVIFSLTLCASLVAGVLAPWIVAYIVAPGFSPKLQAATVDLMRLVLISTTIFSISGLVMGVLHTLQHFLLPAFAPMVYNLGIIFGALVIAPRMAPGYGVYGLVWGSIIGALLHLSVQIPALMKHKARLRPVIDLSDPGLRQVALLMLPRAAALALIHAKLIIRSNLASRLDSGSLSALEYAWDLVQLPETIFATAIATAVFPTLAELAAREAREEIAETFNHTLRSILLLTTPAAIGFVTIGTPLVRAFYERGQFGLASSTLTSYAIGFFAFGIVGHGLLEIVSRTFYAQKDTLRPLYAAVIMLVVTGSVSYSFLGTMGIGSIALGDTLGVFAEVGILYWWLRGRLLRTVDRGLVQATFKIVAASVVMGLVLIGWMQLVAGWNVYVVAGGGVLLGAMVYGLTALLIGLEEIKLVPGMILRRRLA